MSNLTSQIFNEINGTARITFEKATEVTTDPWFFVPLIIWCAIFMFFLLIPWAAIQNAGNNSDYKVIEGTAFKIIFLFLVGFLLILIMLMIFPVYLKFFQ